MPAIGVAGETRVDTVLMFHALRRAKDGLYFVGQGTHPGAGMPGVLCSAKVLERLIPPVK